MMPYSENKVIAITGTVIVMAFFRFIEIVLNKIGNNYKNLKE